MPHNLDKFIFVGGMSTRIEYDDSKNQWNLTHATSRVSANSLARKDTLVLGKHNWMIHNDHKWCQEGIGQVKGGYDTQLKLTACKVGEFTCNTGQCITMEERCDQISDSFFANKYLYF